MIKAIVRLEFKNVFPEEDEKDVLYYLKNVSKYMLLHIIGFTNTSPKPNFNNFVSDKEISSDIIKRVVKFSKENNINEKPITVSREASLKLAEIILTNHELLIENSKVEEKSSLDELNLFKAFLIVNKELNSRQNLSNSEENLDTIIDIAISTSFPTSDIGIFENSNLEFLKLIFTTITRFELIIDFLQSDTKYNYLEKGLYEYFKLENSKELTYQMKVLFGKILEMKAKNWFKLKVNDEKEKKFTESLISEKIEVDDDFTNLKNHPLYKLDINTYSIIDYFFVLDKFVKSVKFVLKSVYHKHHNLPMKDGSFFSFFNKKFSEDFLMKNTLDKIFKKKYLIKKTIYKDNTGEPDYYVRHNNRVFLFENKDVLIAKKIKSSADIEKINNVLKSKFLVDKDKRPVGIGQLVNSIKSIIENKFAFDDYVNTKNNLTIYPILLVNDRIFEIIGINYRLNQWYLESVKTELGKAYDDKYIKNLTIVDIDTLIYWTPYLEKNDANFKNIIDDHLKKMIKSKKINHHDSTKRIEIKSKNLATQLSPISGRLENNELPYNLISDKLKEIIPK